MPQPVRAAFEVETAGPSGTLTVPTDAIMLDPPTDTWKSVGSGTQATSKVIFDYTKYFSADWHHGIDITMADVVYSIYQSFDIAYDDDKSKVERALAVTARPFLDTFKGFRVLDENRLEVYVDFWHFEENYIASYASPSSVSMPWEVLAAMDDLVFEQRRAAYSDTAAGRFDVPWISLVQDRDARLVRTTLLGFQREGTVPESVFMVNGRSLVTEDEAQARYQAVLDWFSEHNLMVISNGPFMLTRYDPPAQFAELTANRHPDYPFSKGDFSFGEAELVRLSETRPRRCRSARPTPLRCRSTALARSGCSTRSLIQRRTASSRRVRRRPARAAHSPSPLTRPSATRCSRGCTNSTSAATATLSPA